MLCIDININIKYFRNLKSACPVSPICDGKVLYFYNVVHELFLKGMTVVTKRVQNKILVLEV